MRQAFIPMPLAASTANVTNQLPFPPGVVYKALTVDATTGAAEGPYSVRVKIGPGQGSVGAGVGVIGLVQGIVRDPGNGSDKDFLSWTGSLGPLELTTTIIVNASNDTGAAGAIGISVFYEAAK